MKKRLISTLLILVLAVALVGSLVACSEKDDEATALIKGIDQAKDNLEAAGYTVKVYSTLDGTFGASGLKESSGIRAYVDAKKDDNYVQAFFYAKAEDAEKRYMEAKEQLAAASESAGTSLDVSIKGNWFYTGTRAGVAAFG